MAHSAVPGRHIEIFMTDADRVVDLDIEDEDPGLAAVLVHAVETDDPDLAEQVLREGVSAGTVRRRP
jgi:hypothetical protein